ncbi:hypothetical protein VTK73DRAFT_3457 [Phialemonium thermophilum]|uniref:Uncharacterized protein n=1 Tax=Phialemonium thermophilum TaxID=223376 RepID=A0ABR3VI30_9PEZI
MRVDIVDCQVYAGAKRLVGRRISTRDYANIVSRMKAWARLPSTRHAVLHAFRLLYHVLVDPRRRFAAVGHVASTSATDGRHHSSYYTPVPQPTYHDYHHHQQQRPSAMDSLGYRTYYSCRADSDPHRPWIMYYAVLCIWSFVMAYVPASDQHAASTTSQPPYRPPPPMAASPFPKDPRSNNNNNYRIHAILANHMPPDHSGGPPSVAEYLGRVAERPELDDDTAATLRYGLPGLLDEMREILAEAHWELLQEARDRLGECKRILLSGGGET